MALTLTTVACGYRLQGSFSPFLDQENIKRVYIEPIQNDTFKPGVEIKVQNALVETIRKNKRVRIVSAPESADAIVKGVVNSAKYNVSTEIQTSLVEPVGVGPTNRLVADIYRATLNCRFSLHRINNRKNLEDIDRIWDSIFVREKEFQGSNALGVQGTTNSLINESEFDRALTDLSRLMMDDVHEFMLAMF